MARPGCVNLLWAILPGLGVGCGTLLVQPAANPAPVVCEQRITANSFSEILQTSASAVPPANAREEANMPAFPNAEELSAAVLVSQVLARNPSLTQMIAAWQVASARYPQVVSIDDPMFGFMTAPASIGSNGVEFGYRLE